MSGARIVLVGTPIGNLGDLSPRARAELSGADVVACEDTRVTGKLLSLVGIEPQKLIALHAHNEASQSERLIRDAIEGGLRVVVVSDAGMPSVSDPGQRLVAAAVGAGIAVDVVPGPSAAVAALVVSGLPTDRFVFEGFLPRKGKERAERLFELESEPRTIVMFESPHRLADTLADLRDAWSGDRRAAVARELTKRFEEVWHGTLTELAERAAATPPRGEVAVVVEGRAAPSPPSADEVDAALRVELASGATVRDAADVVATRLGLRRREVYRAAVRLAGR